MSKLLKSKILLGVFALVLTVLVASSALAADGAITKTLKKGMKDVQVKYLQQTLNEKGYTVATTGAGSVGKETTTFGPATLTAVKKYQAAMGLVADGIFGPKSREALEKVATTTTLPADCVNGALFSASTGKACTGTTPTTPVVTGPVSVTLATDNPASGSFVVQSPAVATGGIPTTFAKYTFTGAGTVTTVKLLRTGVSSSTTVNNVYLYDGATRLTDGASIGSDNTVTFNSLSGLFTVAGSKTISVVADAAVADYSLGFNLVGYTANGTASTVNVVGNQMFGASATLATITMSAATGSGNTDAGTDINVWQGTATIATRDVLLKSLALRQIGSIVSTDINNFKLYADGVLVATVASLDSNGYVTFATPYALKTGARTLKVTADVLGGSGRTVQLSLRGAYDLQATDTQYNVSGYTTATFPFGPASFTVNAGTMTVVKTNDSQSTNVTLGASDQSLAKYTFTAYGEPIKVETLKVGMVTNGTPANVTLRNVRILVNGAQVGSNTSVPADVIGNFTANTGTQFTTNFVVYPGTPATVEIHSDIYDNEGTDDIAAGTVTAIQAVLVGGAGSSNATPQVSLGTINVPSAVNVLGNNLTISSGSMAVAKTASYASRSVSVPQTAYKIGSYQLTGNSTEAVNLNTIYVGWDTQTGAPATDLSDLYIVYGGVMSPVKGTVSATALNGNSWSINKTLGINETMQIDVYATIASSLGTNNIVSTLAVAGTTANSGIATYADASGNTSLTAGVVGQTITGAVGSVTMSQDSSTALAQIVDDSAVVKTLTAKIVALTDSYTVTDMTVTVSDVSAVSTVTLKDHDTGAVIGAAKSAQTSLTWSGLTYTANAGDTKKIDVELALAPVGVNAGTSGSAITTAISGFTARNGAGTSAAGTGSATGNALYVYKAIPTLSLVSMPVGTGTLSAGTSALSKFSVNTSATGTIAWNRIIFTIAKTSAPILTFSNTTALYNADSGTLIPGTVTVIDSAGAPSCLATLTACNVQFIPTNEEQVSGTKNYVLKTTVSGTLVSTDYVTTSIANAGSALGHVAPAAYLTVAPATGVGSFDTYAHAIAAPSFVWSDVSAASHATTTLDWNNDFLVKNLPLDSQTIHM